MADKLDIPLHGSKLNIVKKCGAALSEILDIKFGCVARFEGVDFEETSFSQRKPAPVVPEERLAIHLQGGVKVSVWKADLTDFRADAVVNAANERLQHYGGLALALSIAGGPEIQKESDGYVSIHGNLRTGEAVTLGSGSLPCKKIIHAVGPDLPFNFTKKDYENAKSLLEKTIQSIFKEVEKYRLENVAIPAISSGLFNFPLPECADTIVSAVKDNCGNLHPRRHHPKEVFLVNHDEPTVKEIERACLQILGVHKQLPSYSQAAASNTKAASKMPLFSIQIGKVNLFLKMGRIEEQKTDVIVNTASKQLDLNVGLISKAILQKAGLEMQRDMHKADKRKHIICTRSYKLDCKEVYHTFCLEKGFGPSAASQILYDSVFECLLTAAQRRHKSISFPAIGTGALGFTKDESANIMLHAVTDFAQNSSHSLEVFFVIFPSDHDTYLAFERKMRSFQQSGSDPSFTPGHDKSSEARREHYSSKPPNPQISLLGSTDEARREAEKWLSDLLSLESCRYEICNNFIQHFSEEDHLQLSLLTERGVSVEEFFSQGHACIVIQSNSKEDTAVAVLKVEELLCKIQKEFVTEEKRELELLSGRKVSYEKRNIDLLTSALSDLKRACKYEGLWIEKMEKIENPALKTMFDSKKNQLGCSSSQRMYQLIPPHFCEMIQLIGFHAECAPPEDPKYGEGIYFAQTIKTAMELWKKSNQEYLYFVQAEVLTGNSAPGKRGLILPPPIGQDPRVIHDSVSGGSGVAVIFSGYQALPRYIIICKKMGNVSSRC